MLQCVDYMHTLALRTAHSNLSAVPAANNVDAATRFQKAYLQVLKLIIIYGGPNLIMILSNFNLETQDTFDCILRWNSAAWHMQVDMQYLGHLYIALSRALSLQWSANIPKTEESAVISRTSFRMLFREITFIEITNHDLTGDEKPGTELISIGALAGGTRTADFMELVDSRGIQPMEAEYSHLLFSFGGGHTVRVGAKSAEIKTNEETTTARETIYKVIS